MRWPILALFDRSLRVESRMMSTYAKRLVFVVLILFILIGAHASIERVGAAGLEFFKPVVYVSFVFISLAGISYFASAITEEKEETTLGLLKMSNLNGVAILLGKSTSRLLGAIMLLLAQFPFTLLAVTLGGVSLAQVFAAYATLLSYLVLLCNVALFASVRCRRMAGATGLTSVLIGGFLAAGPVGTGLLFVWRGRMSVSLHEALAWLTGALSDANPLLRIGEIMGTTFDGTVVGAQVISNLAAGAVFFGLSWALFERWTREERDGAPGRALPVLRWLPGRWVGVSRPWRRALAWKEFHFLAGGRLMVAGRLIALGGIVAIFVWLHEAAGGGPVPAEFIGGALMILAVGVSAVELAGLVSRVLQTEVQWHTLPDLMLLPLSTRELVVAKLGGVLLAMVPYGVAFLVGAVLCPRGFGEALAGLLGTSVGWHMLAQYVAFVSFVAYMSLVLKRLGAFAAFAIWIVGNQVLFIVIGFLLMPVAAGGAEAMLFLLSLALVGFAIGMWKATIARLERLAGQ